VPNGGECKRTSGVDTNWFPSALQSIVGDTGGDAE
jgi:hypothetical protein